MVQTAWTFVNDSLCTTLCLQWEPEIVAVSLLYLACRMKRCEVTDWEGRGPVPRGTRWYEHFIEGITHELLEGELLEFLTLLLY